MGCGLPGLPVRVKKQRLRWRLDKGIGAVECVPGVKYIASCPLDLIKIVK